MLWNLSAATETQHSQINKYVNKLVFFKKKKHTHNSQLLGCAIFFQSTWCILTWRETQKAGRNLKDHPTQFYILQTRRLRLTKIFFPKLCSWIESKVLILQLPGLKGKASLIIVKSQLFSDRLYEQGGVTLNLSKHQVLCFPHGNNSTSYFTRFLRTVSEIALI